MSKCGRCGPTPASCSTRCCIPDFGAGNIGTGFIEQHLDELVPDPEPDDALWRGAAAVATAMPEDEPLADLAGFRMNAAPQASVALGRGGEFRSIALDDEQPMAAVSGFRDDERVVVFYEGQATEFALTSRGSVGAARRGERGDHRADAGAGDGGRSGGWRSGDQGPALLTLEAMKMEHGLVAPFDGTVAEVGAEAGAQVGEGAVLAQDRSHARTFRQPELVEQLAGSPLMRRTTENMPCATSLH